jgi:ABC-2 type transport system ATP-binding protein
MIEVEHLTKDYGTVVAVRDVSFQVKKGEVVGFLGPNGAGKSTTMRILVGFLGPTSGKVRIDGHDVIEDSLEARRSIGYMPESAPLYPEMRVREYLTFRAAVKKLPRGERGKSVERAMEQAAVSEMSETLIGHLSKGYRQRVGLADALVANPPLLILDEPTAGLDPNQIRDVRKLIRNLGETHTILLSTHILSEVESTCDRAIVIDRGRLVAQGTLDELRARRRAGGASILVRGDEAQVKKVLGALEGVKKIKAASETDDTKRYRVQFANDVNDTAELLERAIAALVSAGLGVREASPVRATLEEVFAELTRNEERDNLDEDDT